jgi:hypothetical protein
LNGYCYALIDIKENIQICYALIDIKENIQILELCSKMHPWKAT